MSPELVKVIVDSLFEELEKKFANKPLVAAVLHVVHNVALDLLPVLLSKLAAKGLKS